MGDDPLPAALVHTDVVSGQGGSAATGGSVVNIHPPISKNGTLALVLVTGLALGIAGGALLMANSDKAETRESVATLRSEVAALREDNQRKEREVRMLEYYVLEVDGKLIHAGLIEPREKWSPSKKAEYQKQLGDNP